MEKFSESELPLNRDGSVYHLHLKKGQLAETIFLVSDPSHVHLFSQNFEEVTFEMNQREFITHTGILNDKKISVISTGIGVDNMEIVMQEVDLVFNVDLKKRTPNPVTKPLKFILLNLADALQEDIKPGAKIIADYAIGFDNLLSFYSLDQKKEEKKIANLLQESVTIDAVPYCVRSSSKLKDLFYDQETIINGNIVTTPGYYAPRGRSLRLKPENKRFFNELMLFHSRSFWLTHFDMESSAFYAFARMLDHQALTVSLVASNLATGEIVRDIKRVFEKFIHEVQQKI